MDISVFATDISASIAPFLPYLTSAGGKVLEGAESEFGADAWRWARTLWGRLSGRLEARPVAAEVIRDLAEAPDDADALAAFRGQLKKVLVGDEEYVEELRRILKDRPESVRPVGNITASGPGAVAIGGSTYQTWIHTGHDGVQKPN